MGGIKQKWGNRALVLAGIVVGTGRIYTSFFFLFSKDTSVEKKMAKGRCDGLQIYKLY